MAPRIYRFQILAAFCALIALAAPADAAETRLITVSGTVNDPSAAVKVNGAPVPLIGGVYSADVLLNLGPNLITVTATDSASNSNSQEITVYLRPAALTTRTIPVTGTIDDPTHTVTVNGTPATISGTTYSANVTVNLGLNTITAVATDSVGNQSSSESSIFLVRPPLEHP